MMSKNKLSNKIKNKIKIKATYHSIAISIVRNVLMDHIKQIQIIKQ